MSVVNFSDFVRKPMRAPAAVPVNEPVQKERDRRYQVWQKAEHLLRFYEALADVAHPARFLPGVRDAEPFVHLSDLEHWMPLADKRNAARDALLLTPAPRVADLNRKKAILASPRQRLIDSSVRAAAEKLIAADAVWLASTAPVRRARRATD
jgi:hypothetical protein